MANEFRSVGIVATGSYVPERVVTNQDIVDMGIDTSDEWIRDKIGIKERRWASEDQRTSDLATNAAKKALKNANLKPDEIDFVLVATCTPDFLSPPTACFVQDKLGAKKAAAIDINNACSGFVYGLAIGSKFVADGTYKNVLLVGAEKMSDYLDYNDRLTSVFFGDGAGAVVLREVDEGHGLLSNYLRADGSGAMNLGIFWKRERQVSETYTNNLIVAPHMDGKAIWNFAIKAFPDAVINALQRANLEVSDVDFIIPHQANVNIIKKSMESLELPIEKTFLNIDKYGNTVGASIPTALDEALTLGKINKGDIVVLVGFGGGLSWGANVIRW